MGKSERRNGELTRNEVEKFLELIDDIQVKDIFIKKENFEVRTPDFLGDKTNIELKIGLYTLEIEDSCAEIEYIIRIKNAKKLIYKQKTTYAIKLSIANVKKAKDILANDKIRKFFIEKQLNKIIWPFLRVDFHNNLARVGIRPFTLPLLK